jgi:peptide chain release factor subunit 1
MKVFDIADQGFDDLTPLSLIDLKSLSKVSDKEDTFLSAYMSTGRRSKDRKFISSRLEVMRKALPKDLKKPFEETVPLVKEALDSDSVKGEGGRIIYASAPSSFLKVYRTAPEISPLVALDRTPFLLPLARLRDDYADYGLLLIDSREARIFTVRSSIIVQKENASIDLMNKHKKGGMSQMRFNRLRRGAISSFLSRVAEDLRDLDGQAEMAGLVLAGPGEAKSQLLEMLSPSLKRKVLDILDIDIETSPGELVKLGDEIAREMEINSKEALAEKLKDAVLRGEPAAYGPAEVKEALQEGRVRHLLLSDGFEIPGMVCKSCHFSHRDGEACPECGGQMEALRQEELLLLSKKSGAEVVMVEDDEFLKSVGGAGGLFRY